MAVCYICGEESTKDHPVTEDRLLDYPINYHEDCYESECSRMHEIGETS